MAKLKSCRKCGKSKPFAEYSKDRSTKDGYNRKCKSCMSTYFKLYSKTYKPPIKTDGIKSETEFRCKTDISVLLNVNQVDDKLNERIFEARQCFKAYMTAYSQGRPFEDVLKECGIERSLQWVRYLIIELKEAARQGMSLEQYFREGQNFKKKSGPPKVLVTAKK